MRVMPPRPVQGVLVQVHVLHRLRVGVGARSRVRLHALGLAANPRRRRGLRYALFTPPAFVRRVVELKYDGNAGAATTDPAQETADPEVSSSSVAAADIWAAVGDSVGDGLPSSPPDVSWSNDRL